MLKIFLHALSVLLIGVCCLVNDIIAQKGYIKNIYLDVGSAGFKDKPLLAAQAELKQQGYNLIFTKSLKKLKDPYLIVSIQVRLSNDEALRKYPSKLKVLILSEPPAVIPHNYEKKYHTQFGTIYTWRDDLVDNKKYFKHYYYAMRPMIDLRALYQEKKLCVLMNANKISHHPLELYSERKKTIEFYEKNYNDEFDLYGPKWDKERYSVYKGCVQNKIDCLSKYKFCMCYENISDMPGYITEKIFDCFTAGCIPIYWGAPNVTNYIPKNCFIDRRDFKNDTEVYNYIKQMPIGLYETYIKNIKFFLASPQAKIFSADNAVSAFISIIKNAEAAADRQ